MATLVLVVLGLPLLIVCSLLFSGPDRRTLVAGDRPSHSSDLSALGGREAGGAAAESDHGFDTGLVGRRGAQEQQQQQDRPPDPASRPEEEAPREANAVHEPANPAREGTPDRGGFVGQEPVFDQDPAPDRGSEELAAGPDEAPAPSGREPAREDLPDGGSPEIAGGPEGPPAESLPNPPASLGTSGTAPGFGFSVPAPVADSPSEASSPPPAPEGPTGPSAEGAAAESVPAAPADTTMYLTVPKLGLRDAPVLDTDSDAAMEFGAIHLPQTGYPWEPGANTYVSGHRIGFPGTPSDRIFHGLPLLEPGDEVTITDANGNSYAYAVSEIHEVGPLDTWVTNPVPGRDVLSLQTCIEDFGDLWGEGPDWSARYVVQADRVV